MRAPSKLRLVVAGLAAGGVLAGSGLAAGTAHAQADDPFDFFGGSPGSLSGGSFDFGSGLTAPLRTTQGSGGSDGGFGDLLKDLGKDLGKELGKEVGDRAIDGLLGRDRTGTNTPQTATGDATTQSGDRTMGGRISATVEQVLRGAGISFADWLVKRQPGQNRRGYGTYGEPDRYFRPELQRQFCRIPGYVRLFGTTVGRGRFTPRTFIGGDNLGKTLVVGRNSFLAPSGDKLKRNSTVNFVFLSKNGAEVLRPQPRVARNTVLEDRVRYSTDFLKRGVKYTVVVRYVNTCDEPVVDVLGKIRRR
ncbi:hypothetical protein ACWEPC_27525 [Nonomuraea sp. NPDC004297]